MYDLVNKLSKAEVEALKNQQQLLIPLGELMDMKFCTKCHQFKARMDFVKCSKEKDGLASLCKECKRQQGAERLKNPTVYEKKKLQARERSRLPESRAKHKQWKLDNKSAVDLSNQKYRDGHKEKIKALSFERGRRVRDATPSWIDRNAIIKIYQTARRLTEETGEDHEVDHLVAVGNNDSSVRGLHVPWNMDVKLRSHNRRKTDKFIEELGICMDAPGIKYLSKGCPPITWAEILALP